jgi:hypothetical protein
MGILLEEIFGESADQPANSFSLILSFILSFLFDDTTPCDKKHASKVPKVMLQPMT